MTWDDGTPSPVQKESETPETPETPETGFGTPKRPTVRGRRFSEFSLGQAIRLAHDACDTVGEWNPRVTIGGSAMVGLLLTSVLLGATESPGGRMV